VNCARGGLVVEKALRAAIDTGKVAGAAMDVFETEPAKENVLFGAPNVVCTPHLGASTTEAQENVALQIAEQMADYLTTGAVRNALNMPSISAEEAPRLTPFVKLAMQLGSFAGQLTESGVKSVKLEYEGAVAEMNVRALTAAALAGFLQPQLQTVNMVSAPAYAKERGIHIEETRRARVGVYESYIRLTVAADENWQRSVAGTVFSDSKPRIIQIKGINMEAELGPHMLYVTNRDKPGFIGRLGTLLGERGHNIATFHLGRQDAGGDAIALVEIDGNIPEETLAAIGALEGVVQARHLTF
jgi:D-3-phosphoglycerate dehydrogenase